MIQCKGLVLFDLMFCLKEAAGWRVGVEDGSWEQIEESVMLAVELERLL